MTKYVRRNAWNEGGTLEKNKDLYWYAKAVGKMMESNLSDKTSWWFYAAIHGIAPNTWKGITQYPSVKSHYDHLPADAGNYKDQCQHATWYFIPWHRGYLIAIERLLRKAIKSMKGPYDKWALPYWNYFGGEKEKVMPPAFTARKFYDKEAKAEKDNPLYVERRWYKGGKIVMPIGDGKWDMNAKCQESKIFEGSVLNGKYGGVKTGFHHKFDYDNRGTLEDNPHNFGHYYVGGRTGLMGVPDTAALDPIFYLHHCQIDRMWAEWNENEEHSNPKDPVWINGPDQKFRMPLSKTKDYIFTPGSVGNYHKLDYTFEELGKVESVSPFVFLSNRLKTLGVSSDPQVLENIGTVESSPELVGSNTGAVSIKDSEIQTSVSLHAPSWKTVAKSFELISAENVPDRIYLKLENVTGTNDGNMLHVFVNGTQVGASPLFGLSAASKDDGHHAGSGLSISYEITELADALHINDELPGQEQFQVKVRTDFALSDEDPIHIGRVSIYREKQ